MKPPVTTLSDAKLILDRERRELDPAIEADRELYVERGSETIDDLLVESQSAVASERVFRWFFTGHTGAGKSTELNRFIRDPELTKHYIPVRLSVRDVLDVHNLDFTDLILGYAVSVARVAEGEEIQVSEELQERILKWGAEVEEERELSGSGSVKGGYEFNAIFWKASAEVQAGGEKRKIVREKIQQSLTEFIDLINTLVRVIERQTKRRLLIVVDTLDHVDHRPVRDIYTNHWSSLSKPKVSILTVVPLPMLWEPQFVGKIQTNFTLLRNIKVFQQAGNSEYDTDGFQFFIDMLTQLADISLFTNDAMHGLFHLSGGILRDMIGYAGDAAKLADRRKSKTVEKEDVDKVLEAEKARFRRLLSEADQKILAAVDEDPYPRNASQLGPLVHLKAILFYPNGEGWYGLHPAVKSIIDG